jgi:hypothetical protein
LNDVVRGLLARRELLDLRDGNVDVAVFEKARVRQS